jgi:hypothetical protein
LLEEGCGVGVLLVECKNAWAMMADSMLVKRELFLEEDVVVVVETGGSLELKLNLLFVVLITSPIS